MGWPGRALGCGAGWAVTGSRQRQPTGRAGGPVRRDHGCGFDGGSVRGHGLAGARPPLFARAARAWFGASTRGGLARGADARGGLGELAGLPECQHGFKPGEQAGEAGENEGVQCRHRPGLGGVIVGFGAEPGEDAGDLQGQWGWGIC